MSFVEVLPVEPVIAITLRAELAAPGARERLERRERVLGGEHDARRRRALGGLRVLRARPARPTRPPRAPARRSAPPSCVSPGRPTNRSPGTTARESIVDARRARRRRPAAGAARRAPAACGDPLGRPAPHRAADRTLRGAPRARPSRRRTAASRPPASSCPARGPCRRSRRRRRLARAAIACAIAARRSTSAATPSPARPDAREDLRDDRLRLLRARVVGRDDRAVGEPRGDLPHQRALAAVAVAAAAEHAPQPAARVSSRAARSTFSSESGVCA